jgi:hypothetical protein
MSQTRELVSSIITSLPHKLVSKLMLSVDAILSGSQDISHLLNQCVVGLPDSERQKVLQEFTTKYIERAREYYSLSVRRMENWNRLKQLSPEETEMSDIQQPEPVEKVCGRIATSLDRLQEYLVTSFEAIRELRDELDRTKDNK